MQDATPEITETGQSLTLELREEARRRGLPELEKASDAQLSELVHVLPVDMHEDARVSAAEIGCPTEEILVEIIRYMLTAQTALAS
jgi:hypothetical protein